MIDRPTDPGATVAPRGAEPGPLTRRAAKNAFAVTLAELAGKVATLAFTVAAARALGVEQFGVFAYALSFSLLVATLPSWGFDLLVVQRGSAEPRSIPRLIGEVMTWRTAIAIPVFLAAGLGGFALEPGVRSGTTLVIILVATMVDLYSDTGRAAAAAIQDQVGTSKALVVQRISVALLAIGALAAGFGVVGLALAYLSGTVIGAAGVWISVRRLGIGIDVRGVTRAGLARMGRLSIAIGIDTLVSLALFRIDQVILGAMKGERAVGEYAAAYRLLETVIFFSWAVAKAVFPAMSSAAEAWRVRRGVEEGLGVVAVLYVPFGVGLWIEAERILRLLYGQPYAQAAGPIVRWLAPAPMLFAVGYLASYGLFARDRRWGLATASIVAAFVNVALNLVLIPRLSGTGAAISTSASYGLEGVITIVLLARQVGWIRLHRPMVLPVAAAALMGAVLLVLHLGLLIEVPIAAAVYLAAWLALARRWAPEQLAVLRSLLPGRSR